MVGIWVVFSGEYAAVWRGTSTNLAIGVFIEIQGKIVADASRLRIK